MAAQKTNMISTANKNINFGDIPPGTLDAAEKNVRDILTLSFNHSDQHAAIVVFDVNCNLAKVLTETYRRVLPNARFIDFETIKPEDALALFEVLKPGDLAVLIQSTSFRLSAFRIRIELFNLSIKVIEHPHLNTMEGEQIRVYVDALDYDAPYFRNTGNALRALVDGAATGIVDSGGEKLVFAAGFEPAKMNVGDYSNMKNIGGQFPIGEVFTESKILEDVNGRVRIFAFGDTGFVVNKPAKPITLVIEKGRVIDALDSTPEFNEVLANIVADENDVWVRELGFGLNRAFSCDRIVNDIGSYERMCGVHLSLGAKHSVYAKPDFAFSRRTARHHVDVFAVTEAVILGDKQVYRDGAWRV